MNCGAIFGGRQACFPLPDVVVADQVGAKIHGADIAGAEGYGLEPGQKYLAVDGFYRAWFSGITDAGQEFGFKPETDAVTNGGTSSAEFGGAFGSRFGAASIVEDMPWQRGGE